MGTLDWADGVAKHACIRPSLTGHHCVVAICKYRVFPQMQRFAANVQVDFEWLLIWGLRKQTSP